MPLYNFAVDTGQVTPDEFNSVLVSYRSDVEQRHTHIAIHSPESADILLARRLADEIINVSGAEINLWVRTDNNDFDSVWDEDPDPTYWNRVQMKAFFRPEPLQTELKQWGLDTKNKPDVVFSHRQVIEQLGDRMIRAGDVIQLPYNSALAFGPRNFRVLNSSPSGNFRYIWLYFACQVETLTADITVRVEDDIQESEQIRTGGHYRESL